MSPIIGWIRRSLRLEQQDLRERNVDDEHEDEDDDHDVDEDYNDEYDECIEMMATITSQKNYVGYRWDQCLFSPKI